MIEITYLPLIHAPSSFRRMSLDDAINEIRSGKHNGKVDAARMEFLENGKSIEYKALKDNLPSYIFGGTFDKKISNDSLLAASGIFNIDIDGLGYQGAKECRDFLSSIPQCIFAFLSPSADGVKAGIRIGKVKNDFEYKQYFDPVQALIGKYKNDPAIKDIRRACFVSTDAGVYYNPDATPLVIALSEPKPKEVGVYVKAENMPDNQAQFIAECCLIIEKSQVGEKHHAFLKSGRLAGGYIAAGYVENELVTQQLYNAMDLFSVPGFDRNKAIKAINDGIAKGMGEPVMPRSVINYDDFPDSEDSKPQQTAIDLSNNAHAEDFVKNLIAALPEHCSDLRAIDFISTEIADKTVNFSKLFADFLAGELIKTDGFRGKKTGLKNGIIDAVKLLQRKKNYAVFLKGAKRLSDILPRESFPHAIENENGGLSLPATTENLEHLLKSYGILVAYDEAIRCQIISIPDENGANTHDLHNESCIQRIKSLALANGINHTITERLANILASSEKTTNPVKDFIFSKKWDGVSRLNDMYNTLTVEPNKRVLANKVLRTWFIQCVAALDKGVIGCGLDPYAVAKYELILILQGKQGVEKTKWYGRLLPAFYQGEKFSGKYIKDGSSLVLTSSDSIKQNISCWINELGELDATFRKSDIAQLKAFCSAQRDTMRLPYAVAECS